MLELNLLKMKFEAMDYSTLAANPRISNVDKYMVIKTKLSNRTNNSSSSSYTITDMSVNRVAATDTSTTLSIQCDPLPLVLRHSERSQPFEQTTQELQM